MSFYWYDFETFGADPFRDRPCQFAGMRTDEDFNPVGDPLVIYCKPANDMLPQPRACLITGITPQIAEQHGVVEAEFIKQIHREFSTPGTCVLGYNSLRFDDEVTRNCLYRNFYDPYAREWQNGNSRWDIIDLVRLARAVRPEGINWPDHADGSPSFKLEQLTVANDIEHGAAHDALADVRATIALAGLVRSRQPRLYDYVYQHRDKRVVEQSLALGSFKPLLHISAMYPAQRGCAAVVVPLARDSQNKNAVYVYDLSVDPAPLLELSADLIRERIFTRTEDLPEGVSRIPLKAVHVNKCPVLVPVKVVDAAIAERLEVDIDACLAHLQVLKAAPGLEKKIQLAFSQQQFAAATDPDLMIYSGGFFSPGDRRLMDELRATEPGQLGKRSWPFADSRLEEMLFRYRARNYPGTLSGEESARWEEYRRERILQEEGGGSIQLETFREELAALEQEFLDEPGKLQILSDLDAYASGLL